MAVRLVLLNGCQHSIVATKATISCQQQPEPASCRPPCPPTTTPDNLYFSVIANLSIASLNVSLLVNTVGFYQVGGGNGE